MRVVSARKATASALLYDGSSVTPEASLVVAILRTALADASNASAQPSDRQDAVKWLRDGKQARVLLALLNLEVDTVLENMRRAARLDEGDVPYEPAPPPYTLEQLAQLNAAPQGERKVALTAWLRHHRGEGETLKGCAFLLTQHHIPTLSGEGTWLYGTVAHLVGRRERRT